MYRRLSVTSFSTLLCHPDHPPSPCHLERTRPPVISSVVERSLHALTLSRDDKKNRATGATEACKLLTIRRSTVQDRLKIELLSCTDGATEKRFGATEERFWGYNDAWGALLGSIVA